MEEPRKRRPSIRELSKTPSWVMLGFIIGAACVLALPRRPAEAPRIIIQREPEKPRNLEPPQLTTIEAVFGQWSDYAVWSDDLTQVALWNSAVGDFAEFYEVLRRDGTYYFRSIPQLTSRVIRHGKGPPPECPLRFTETEEQYQEWREHDRFERPAEDVRPGLTVPRTAPATPRPQLEVVTPPMPPPTQTSITIRNDAPAGGTDAATKQPHE
jgi:hypothetical protein